mmetsp:Transcript_36910/g.91874  ORF Transcript_36910/g.91874 Transcript_36910/m.91874 type:complete len:293 (+) Transcript_36910:1261-2139(+)
MGSWRRRRRVRRAKAGLDPLASIGRPSLQLWSTMATCPTRSARKHARPSATRRAAWSVLLAPPSCASCATNSATSLKSWRRSIWQRVRGVPEMARLSGSPGRRMSAGNTRRTISCGYSSPRSRRRRSARSHRVDSTRSNASKTSRRCCATARWPPTPPGSTWTQSWARARRRANAPRPADTETTTTTTWATWKASRCRLAVSMGWEEGARTTRRLTSTKRSRSRPRRASVRSLTRRRRWSRRPCAPTRPTTSRTARSAPSATTSSKTRASRASARSLTATRVSRTARSSAAP